MPTARRSYAYFLRMRFWTGVTDNTWFTNLRDLGAIDEVNFWHPSGRPPFTTFPEGTPFLFKLKSPNNHIAGGGYLVKYESLPLELAWEAFGTKNGARSYEEFARLISGARGAGKDRTSDIGCSIIGAPFFFDREQWIAVGDRFSSNIVSGKSFDTNQADGKQLWREVEAAMSLRAPLQTLVAERPATFGNPTLVLPRRGQGAFRAMVTNAYGRRCAITGESTLPVLEAAHIKPVTSDGLHNTFNGVLLRSDFHKLFDVGLVTITPEHTVVISERITQQWFNGKAYNSLNGKKLMVLPAHGADQPRADFLQWHNENVFERRN